MPPACPDRAREVVRKLKPVFVNYSHLSVHIFIAWGESAMKKNSILLLSICLVALLWGSVAARDAANSGLRPMRDIGEDALSGATDPGLRGMYETAATDTYCLVWYNFETSNWQGWTKLDRTAQVETFFHVDDFAGLGGGSFGGLVPLQGSKSMWCGVRANPADPYLCGWLRAPGYGNDWEQYLTTSAISFVGAITFDYRVAYDSEPGYDYTYVEYDAGGNNWVRIAAYDDCGDSVASHFLPLPQARTKLRFHFSADGAWSDEDGLWNTDGGCIVDELRIRDSAGLNAYQDFEGVPVGAKKAGIWTAAPASPYGSYVGLRNNLADKDPCGENFGTQVVFFIGSPNPSSSYPGLYDTPFCSGPGNLSDPCHFEYIVSPVIDMTKYTTNNGSVQNGTIPAGDLPLLAGAQLWFTVYRDLPQLNLVYYRWSVRNIVNGCPGQWLDRNYVYYGEDQDYIFSLFGVSDLLTSNQVQIGIGIKDMCSVWYNQFGNCAQHTPSPWIDNIRLERYKTTGPQWSSRSDRIDLFQDNFPSDEFDLESLIRADGGNDLLPNNSPNIRPSDSIVVNCSSPLGGGIATDPAGGPAVYLHVKCTYVGNDMAKPAQIAGPQLAGSVATGTPPVPISFRYVSDNGTWTIIQCDTARTGGGTVADRYMVDLNDELFTRGYMIEYYFKARDNAGAESTIPGWVGRTGAGPYFEFTCLPTLNSNVLFVDDFEGRGTFVGNVQSYWDPVFRAVLPVNNQPDRYDVNGPSSGVSNGPGSRAKNKHLIDHYDIIVWDCGNLNSVTISDGTVNSDKSNDCQMLIDWMNLSEHSCGLWICGDEIANDLDICGTAQAIGLMSTWCGVDFVDESYYNLTGGRTGGGVVTPLLTGDAEGILYHGGAPDKTYAYGGCPIVNQFDILEKTASGAYALRYPPHMGTSYYAAIQAHKTNSGGHDVRTMWFGFSYMYVRDDVQSTPQDRFEIAKNVFDWMQNVTNSDVTDAKTPSAYALAQNFPNPFNPSTTIRFDMREKGFMTLKIYNVAGQLVRTLVEGVKDAGSYNVAWDGMNDRGGSVASGIYFYKMETKDFSQTKKMVMLR